MREARPAGLEPATPGLEGRCSVHLSYGRTRGEGTPPTAGQPDGSRFASARGRTPRLENSETGRLEDSETGRLEDWKTGGLVLRPSAGLPRRREPRSNPALMDGGQLATGLAVTAPSAVLQASPPPYRRSD